MTTAGGMTAGGGRGNTSRTRSSMLQIQLNSPDDEWAALEPKILLVEEAQAALVTYARYYAGYSTGSTRGGGGRGSVSYNASGMAVNTTSLYQTAMQDLVDALYDTQMTANDAHLTQRLTALRKAREQAKKDLETAQKNLQALVTLRQEAVLVDLGMLD
jgi:hypothetical protein